MRTVVDAAGHAWVVRATIPSMAERRRQERRGAAGEKANATMAGLTRRPIADRRRRKERRRVQQTRASVTPGFEGGWLTFECALERRRLAPIPDGWTTLPDAELVRLCERATPVALPRRRLIE